MLKAIFTNTTDEITVHGLTQWDKGRTLEISMLDAPDTYQVHFAHKGAKEAYVLEASNGKVNVPNIILTQHKEIMAWIYIVGDGTGETIRKINLPVKPRTKPADYIYEETEVLSYGTLLKRIQEMEEKQSEIIKAAVETYLEENPVEGMTEEQKEQLQKNMQDIQELEKKIPTVPVQSVNGKTGSVQLSASDVGALPSTTKIPSKPSDIGAEPSGTAESKMFAHNTSNVSHNDIRLLIQNLANAFNAFLDIDDETMNQATEMVGYMKDNRELIEQITTGKVSVSDIVNDYVTNVSNKPVSAAVAVRLKALIDAIVVPTKTSQLANDSGFLTGTTGATKVEFSQLQEQKADKTAIPTKTSQLTNDSNYVEKAVTDALSEEIKDLGKTIDGVLAPTFAGSVDDMTDTSKMYIGSNGNLWAYTSGLVENKVNQYNATTAKFNGRVHSSYIGTDNDPWRTTKGFLHVEINGLDFTDKTSYIVRINGVTPVRSTNMGCYGQVLFFNKPAVTSWDFTGYTSDKYFDTYGSFKIKQDDIGYYVDLMDANPSTDTTRCYFSIVLTDNVTISASDCPNLFIEAVPLTTYTKEYSWQDTGIPYSKYDLTEYDIEVIAKKVSKKIKAVLYVDNANGNDTNAGSQGNPLKTIQKAVDSDASLILVKSGVYDETVTITRNNVHICLYDYPNFSTDVPRLEKIQVNNMVIRNCNDITIEGVEVIGNTVSAFYAKNVSNLNMIECTAHDGNCIGFELYNVNGRFNGCTAYNLDYQGDPLDHIDGFNIHGYGYTEFINCSAWNCGDDGISHHDGCTGLISGGEFYGCGKGGVSSPTNGAEITIEGVYSHDNVYGIYAVSSGSKTYIRNCVLKNNTYDLTVGQNVIGFAWNNIYDTKSIADGFTEFNN